MSKKFSIILILVLAFLLTFPFAVQALPVGNPPLIGDRSSPSTSGVWANNGWDGGNFEIDWEITYSAGDPYPWTYEYTITAAGDPLEQEKAMSHIILEISDDADASDFSNFTGTFTQTVEIGTYRKDKNEPFLPAEELYGMKFQGSGGDITTIKFDSTRAPMWGSFFAKDGQNPDYPDPDPKEKVIAYNNGLDIPSDNEIDYIAVPDTFTTVPEPSTILLFGSLLIGLGLIGIKKG